MKTKRWGILVVVIMLLAAALVAGCGSGTTTTTAAPTSSTAAGTGTTAAPSSDTTAAAATDTTAAAPAVAVKEWVIPQISVTTGPVAFAGEPAAWGAQKAVDEINAAGGIEGVPVKLTEADTGFDPAKAVSAATSAVSDALVVLGPMDAPGGEATAPIYFDAKVPSIGAFSTPKVRSTMAPYGSFYMLDNMDGAAVTAWLKANPDIKTVVGFGDPSDPGAYDGYLQAKDVVQKLGLTWAKDIEVKSGQLDLATPASQAIQAGAQGYVCVLRQEEMAKLALELQKKGMTEPRRIYMTFAALGSGLLDLAKGSLEGAYSYNNFDPNSTEAKYKAFADAFSAAHNNQALVINTPVTHYNAVYALKAIFESLHITGDPSKRAEERQAIAEAIYNSQEFQGLQGTFKWVNGQLMAPTYVMQIKNNQVVTLGPIQ